MKTAQEIFTKEVNEFTDQVTNVVKGIFQDNQKINPIVFALVTKENGELAIAVLDGLGEFFTSPNGKDKAAEIIKHVGKQLKPLCIAFISEAWAAAKSLDEYHKFVDENGNFRDGVPSPSEDPNKVEVLMIHIETFDKERFKYWSITEKDGQRELKETDMFQDWTEKSGKGRGRFSNLLEENHSEWAKRLQNELKVNLN